MVSALVSSILERDAMIAKTHTVPSNTVLVRANVPIFGCVRVSDYLAWVIGSDIFEVLRFELSLSRMSIMQTY